MLVTTIPGSFFPAADLFLRTLFPPAAARSRERLDPSDRARLEAFARGELSAGDRKALMPLLASQPLAIEYLARLLKEASTSGEEEE